MLGLAHRGKRATIASMKATALAHRFKLARERLRISLQSLEGPAPKLPRGYPSMIESGQRQNLGPDMLARAAVLLQVRFEWLATGRGPMELGDEAGFPRVLDFDDDAHYAALVRGHARRMGMATEVAERAIEMAARDGKADPEQIPGLLIAIARLTPDSGNPSHPLLQSAPHPKRLPPRHRD